MFPPIHPLGQGHRELLTPSSSPTPNQPLGISNQNLAAVGTPEFPYAATGPMQYVRKFFYQFNGSHNGTLLEYCTSVFAEPTRGRVLDGMYGRANGSIMIAQPRRQRPGWDGCRDRADGNPHLPQVPI